MPLWSHLPAWCIPAIRWQLQARRQHAALITADELLLLLGATPNQLKAAIERNRLTLTGPGFTIEQVLGTLDMQQTSPAPVSLSDGSTDGTPPGACALC